MDSSKPSLAELQKFLPLANFVLLVVLLLFVAPNSCSRQQPDEVDTPEPVVVVNDDADVALKNAESLLASGNFLQAYDMLLVASRIASSDPKLFDLVVSFIDQASSSESEDDLAMAEDLLDRGDSLVFFQRPENVQSARTRLTELREKFFANEPEFIPPDPVGPVSQFIAVAKNESNPIYIRTKAVEQARTRLDDLRLQIALGEQAETEQLTQAAMDELLKTIDTVEQQCIEILFANLTPSVEKWQSTATQKLQEAANASQETAPKLMQSLSETAGTGFEMLQELRPYAKSGIKDAIDKSKKSEDLIKKLQRQENWLYNKQSLALIRFTEAVKELSPKEKLGKLAVIQEEKLSDYVLRRFNEVWGKIFEELPNEDEKADAVRMRILGVNK